MCIVIDLVYNTCTCTCTRNYEFDIIKDITDCCYNWRWSNANKIQEKQFLFCGQLGYRDYGTLH